jgi:Fur family transcriptional regulator, zinc uptake regulator
MLCVVRSSACKTLERHPVAKISRLTLADTDATRCVRNLKSAGVENECEAPESHRDSVGEGSRSVRATGCAAHEVSATGAEADPGSGRPTTAHQLLDRMHATHHGAAPPTVYRALDFLMEQGLFHRVERLNAFIACSDADHPHAFQFLICGKCGTVAEMEDRAAEKALERAAQREGFHLMNAVVEIEGTCATCSRPT